MDWMAMTKEQLIEELEKLRQRFSELESQDIKQKDNDEMRRKYEFIVNTSRHFMTLVSRDFVFEAANTAYCKAIGKSRNQVVGHTVADVWGTKLFRKSIKPIFEKCFEGNTVEKYHDIVHFPELGSRPFEVSYYPYHDKKGNITHAVVVSRDISERRMIEEELIRLEKLESLGVLAGGIAHDFNNLLTSILGNVGLAKRSIDSQGKTMTQLNKAEKSCKRAKNLTHKLLTFATGGEPVKKLVTFGDLLAEVKEFIPESFTGHGTKDGTLKISITDKWISLEDESDVSSTFLYKTSTDTTAIPTTNFHHNTIYPKVLVEGQVSEVF